MRRIISFYNFLIYSGAFISAVMLVWLMVSIITSVTMRNFGMQPYAWLFTSNEYALLCMTMLGAPWLVREKGHVYIELVTAALPADLRAFLSRGIALLCVLVSLVLAWEGAELFHTNIRYYDYDVRAYYFPKWILTITFPISFFFMAMEFSRFAFGRELMHTGQAGIHD